MIKKQKTNFAFYVAAFVLILMFAFQIPPNTKVFAENSIKFWSAPSWDKVLLDEEVSAYSKGEAKLSVSAARAEYESGQLIMTPSRDVKAYDVEIESLSHKDLQGVYFSKENITVYNQKYIAITRITTSIKVPTGNYPDALVPFANAKAAGENNIKAGNNQALFITFNVPETQAAGVYEGNIKITVDGKEQIIPVELTIWDLTVSTTVNARSIFASQYQFQHGELDTTQAMLNAYHDALLEYRLSPHILMIDNAHTDKDIRYYTELAYSYAINPRCTSVSLPHQAKWNSAKNEADLDTDVLTKYLLAFAKKSFEENFNLLAKTTMYMQLIDEPVINGWQDKANLVSKSYNETLKKVSEQILNDATVTSPLKEEVANSILAVPNIVTSHYSDEISEHITSWCPVISDYHTEEQRSHYDHQQEKWWYSCVEPKNPFPSYHIDDFLLSSRVYSWMQADYGVTGNLYWATNAMIAFRNNDAIFLEDPYQTAERFPNGNGDGFLFYPGKKYGIFGPLGSRRLHSIRDGMEEYEIILSLQEKYKELSKNYGIDFNADQVLDFLFDKLYTGTKMYTSSQVFSIVRESLAKLAVLSNSDSKVAVIGVKQAKDNVILELVAADDCKVSYMGQEASTRNVNGKKVYSVTLPVGGGIKTLTIEKGSDSQNLSFYIGGEFSLFKAEDLSANFSADDGSITMVNAVDFGLGTGKMMRLSLPKVSDDNIQQVRYKGSLLPLINANARKIILTVYNSSSETVRMDIRMRFTGKNISSSIEIVQLKPGLNTIELHNFYGYYWKEYQSVDYMLFQIGSLGDKARNNLYFGDVEFYSA